MNDTACTQFSIIDRLKGDYYVGVGKQFQTIHQAVDTMKFRGIGANVRMILTDTSYTENGTTDVSTAVGRSRHAQHYRPIGYLDRNMDSVSGPVHPTITLHRSTAVLVFTWATGFAGWMNFEGYNPSTVPTPDKVMAEPAKRGMTIVKQETNAGAVFGIEEGASNITLKDLIIHGNGALSKQWICERFLLGSPYLQRSKPVRLCARVQRYGCDARNSVNNCELGNVKYGIYDHGFHDEFDPYRRAYYCRHGEITAITFTRNTVGTAANPISYAGIQINGENGLVISHNEITNINAS